MQEIYGRKCLRGTSERGLEKGGSASCLYCSSESYEGDKKGRRVSHCSLEFQLSQWEIVSLQGVPSASSLWLQAACGKCGLSTVMLVDPTFNSFGPQSITLSSAKTLSGPFSLLLQSTTGSTQIYFSTLTWGGAPQWFPRIRLHEEKL